MKPWPLLLGLVSAPALAAPLSLTEAVDAALLANPDLRTAQLTLDQAQADVIAARGEFDPTLSMGAGYDRSSSLFFLTGFPDPFDVTSSGWNANTSVSASAPTGTTVSLDGRLRQSTSEFVGFTGDVEQQLQFVPSFTATLSQDLLRGIKLSYNLQSVRSAGIARGRAELQAEAALQQAMADVASGYWNWVYQEALAEIGEDSVEVAEEALRVAHEKVEAGELAPLEETRLAAAAVQSATDALAARNAAQDALDSLLLLMGRVPGEDIEPSSSPGEASELSLDVGAVVTAATEGNLDVAVARTQLEDAQLSASAARHAMLPSLTAELTGGYSGGNDTSWKEAFGQLDGFPTLAVSGNFAVPLGNRAARGQNDRADAAVHIAQEAVDKAERQVRASAATQARTLQSARERIRLADANLDLSERTLAAQEALYEAGRLILSEVLDARAEVARTRAEAVKARTDARLAEVELLRLQGKLTRAGLE